MDWKVGFKKEAYNDQADRGGLQRRLTNGALKLRVQRWPTKVVYKDGIQKGLKRGDYKGGL